MKAEEWKWSFPDDRTPERKQMDAELAALNQAVEDAVTARTAWMDDHMTAYAKWQVGDELFDLASGDRIGVVSGLYRVHGSRRGSSGDWRFDTSMNVEYEVNTCRNCFTNTSCCHGTYKWGTKAERMVRLEQELHRLTKVDA